MGIYQNFYELVHTYIYGGVTLTPDMTLVCTFVSTLASLFLIALPFLIVLKILKMIL